jgi:LmbE family N-acetylglucosaminyl deacetylase
MKASASADRRRPAPFGCILLLVLVGLALSLSFAVPRAQLRVQPVGEHSGEVALRLMLRKLTTVGTFMQTTAHPDDEDNILLAQLGHGRGMRTVLVSATRGEGGQNEIGPELFEALSVLRTEELLAAHRFDGAEQFFTRAVDFGMSFSVEETFEKWGRAEIVGDYVRHIRATRPHVVAGFVCGGEGGGQHHQASTALTIEAVRDAADPSKYPEQVREGLRPWRVMRLFCTQGLGKPETAKDLFNVDGREFDPLIGRTYAELGTEARSMHKCQGTSQLLPLPGAGFARIYKRLQGGSVETAGPLETMFDGIDTSIAGLARFADGDGSVAPALRAVSDAAASGDVSTGLRRVRELRARLKAAGLADEGRYEINFRLEQKERQFEQALLLRHGIRLEALADDGVVVDGQPLKVTTVVTNRSQSDIEIRRVTLHGLATKTMSCAGIIRAEGSRTCTTDASVSSAGRTGIYWRARPDAARYEFDPGVPFGVPFAPSPFRTTFELAINGDAVTVERTIEYRYSDIVAGEKRMELHVVPAFGLELSPSLVVVPRDDVRRVERRRVRVIVTNTAKAASSATVRLRAPAGFEVSPQQAAVTFTREDEVGTVEFTVQPPPNLRPAGYAIEASVGPGTVSGAPGSPAYEPAGAERFGYQVIEYPHIRRRHIVRRATGTVSVLDARIEPGLRVGYIAGVGDQVPQAIEQLGAAVQMIGSDELAGGDLSKYNVIMTGVRAYERRADLRANNHRLIAYAERGGTVLVQYNKFEFNEAQYGPFPAKVSANRVSDEHAPVDVLLPAHPVFNRPNRIGADDWAGWVQERGLYFLGDRDPRYVDLVRLTDPFPFNAGPKTGALVEAKVGKGRWIYLGLGLWRQLPAGTEGAYRLLANLLSLGSRRQ